MTGLRHIAITTAPVVDPGRAFSKIVTNAQAPITYTSVPPLGIDAPPYCLNFLWTPNAILTILLMHLKATWLAPVALVATVVASDGNVEPCAQITQLVADANQGHSTSIFAPS